MSDVDESGAAREALLDCGRDFNDVRFHDPPIIGTQDDHSDLPLGHVLLVGQSLVGSNEQVKASCLRRSQQRRRSSGQTNPDKTS
jgi:hypothetical protein